MIGYQYFVVVVEKIGYQQCTEDNTVDVCARVPRALTHIYLQVNNVSTYSHHETIQYVMSKKLESWT